jgi:hypothetical protein
MTFTGFPIGAVIALIAASAGALACLQLLRVRHRELRVMTTLLWVHALERSRARTLIERFRHPLTYLLLLAIFILLCLALGRPQPTASSADRVHEVIVLDAGSDMSAREGDGRSRLEWARQAVLAEAAGLGSTDDLAVMVADPTPRLVHTFEDLRPLLAVRLNAVAVAQVPGERERAVRMARSLLQGCSHPRIVMVTGRPVEKAALQADGSEDVRVVRVGPPVRNAAILSALFVPEEANPLQGRLVVRVAAYGDRPQNVQLLVQRAGGAPLLDASAGIAPGNTHDFTIEHLPADGDHLLLRLAGGDALAADDRSEFHLPLRSPIRIATGEDAPPALRLGLQSDPAVRLVGPQEACEISVVGEKASVPTGHPAITVTQTLPLVSGARAAVNADQRFLRGLDFESAADVLPSAGATAAGRDVLVAVAGQTLASYTASATSPRLELNAALWSPDLSITHRAAFGVFLARAVRSLAGWDADPIVLTPERSNSDPLWSLRAGLSGERMVMPTDRAAADLSAPSVVDANAAVALGRPWQGAEWFEGLLLLAMALVMFEAYLHTRGRIS